MASSGPAQPTEPPTELGRLRVLSSTAGILVSPLALGGGNIGQAWNHFWGHQTKERSFELLDAYFDVRELMTDYQYLPCLFISLSNLSDS